MHLLDTKHLISIEEFLVYINENVTDIMSFLNKEVISLKEQASI